MNNEEFTLLIASLAWQHGKLDQWCQISRPMTVDETKAIADFLGEIVRKLINDRFSPKNLSDKMTCAEFEVLCGEKLK